MNCRKNYLQNCGRLQNYGYDNLLCLLFIVGKAKSRLSLPVSSLTKSSISTIAIRDIIWKLKNEKYRDSTKKNYYRIWKLFNNFFVRLDVKPFHWEEHITLFAAYLINERKQSTTVRSYISAIHAVLADNDIEINENIYLLNSLTKVCRLNYDSVNIHHPICKGTLNIILKAVQFMFDKQNGQPYLSKLYMALFATAYYGLFRIGELMFSDHTLKAVDAHIGVNKKKMMFVLWSSKMHLNSMEPQMIKIAKTTQGNKPVMEDGVMHFCPFEILRCYLLARKPYRDENEQFFVFGDHSAVKPSHFRAVLKKVLHITGFNSEYYSRHSFRAGRALDLLKYGLTVEVIKKLGRWQSNAVYTYLKG